MDFFLILNVIEKKQNFCPTYGKPLLRSNYIFEAKVKTWINKNQIMRAIRKRLAMLIEHNKNEFPRIQYNIRHVYM